MSNFEQVWNSAKPEDEPSRWEIVEHGWEQHVLVDHVHNIVYRYPRNQNAADKLADEIDILSGLNQVAFNIAIPRIRNVHEDYTEYDYIPGDVINDANPSELTDKQAQGVGYDLGIFFGILHGVDTNIVANKTRQQTMSLLEYYQRRINSSPDSIHLPKAKTRLAGIIPASKGVVVHGDLHGQNIVIDPMTKVLAGVIDFSEVEIGDPHQDLRKIFMADSRFLDPALQAYEARTGIRLSKEQVVNWAYVNEWANLAFFHDKPDHPTYLRAHRHLASWGEI